MKKGFTLIELLAVIVILGIISLIFVPKAINIVNNNKTKIYKVKEDILVKATKDYVTSNKAFVLPIDSESKYVIGNVLVDGNYMNKILDATSGNECNYFTKITVNDTYGYNYEACIICDEYTTNKSFCTAATYNSL